MIAKLIQHLVRFSFLLLLQVVVFNHIQWNGYVNPYIYILFILLLPVETPRVLLLSLGFVIGILVDMFGDSGGLHAAATVAMAYVRPSILRLISPRDGYEAETPLSPYFLGLKWFLTYLALSTLTHHFVLFFLEVFRFSEFFITLFKVLLNTAISVSLMVMGQYLFSRSANRNERIIG
jgi:rod shape-determining protein MreD